jgi:hypothetical protein
LLARVLVVGNDGPDGLCPCERRLGGLAEVVRAGASLRRCMAGHVVQQHRAFLDGANCVPKSLLDAFGQGMQKAVRRKGVARMAAEAQDVLVLHAKQRSPGRGGL